MPFSFPKRLFFHNLSATYSFGRRIKGRAADFISATRPFFISVFWKVEQPQGPAHKRISLRGKHYKAQHLIYQP